MKRALVTGGAGFIGSHLCEALCTEGYEVTCLDNFSTSDPANLRHLPQIRLIEGDANDAAVWQRLSNQAFDILFHYAAVVGVKRTEETPLQVLHDVTGLQHIAAFAQQGHAKKIIYASSSEVYGNPHPNELPLHEKSGDRGWSPYATVKLYGEHLFQALWNHHKIPTVSLRFFNVYGPRQTGSNYGFVVAKFIQQVQANTSPTIYGTGQQTRDFVFITDNIKAALTVAHTDSANGRIINVGSGQETSILSLANRIIAAAGKVATLAPVHVSQRTTEIDRRCAATDTMKQLLRITSQVSLEEGIALTVAAMTEEATTRQVAAHR